MSNHHQIQCCYNRMVEIDEEAADQFYDNMHTALRLSQKANAIRIECWEQYRAVTGAEKRPPYQKRGKRNG